MRKARKSSWCWKTGLCVNADSLWANLSIKLHLDFLFNKWSNPFGSFRSIFCISGIYKPFKIKLEKAQDVVTEKLADTFFIFLLIFLKHSYSMFRNLKLDVFCSIFIKRTCCAIPGKILCTLRKGSIHSAWAFNCPNHAHGSLATAPSQWVYLCAACQACTFFFFRVTTSLIKGLTLKSGWCFDSLQSILVFQSHLSMKDFLPFCGSLYGQVRWNQERVSECFCGHRGNGTHLA